MDLLKLFHREPDDGPETKADAAGDGQEQSVWSLPQDLGPEKA